MERGIAKGRKRLNIWSDLISKGNYEDWKRRTENDRMVTVIIRWKPVLNLQLCRNHKTERETERRRKSKCPYLVLFPRCWSKIANITCHHRPLKFRIFRDPRLRMASISARFNWFLQNLAWRCTLTLLRLSTVKILNFQKSKMADGSHIQNWKITMSATVRKNAIKFGTMIHSDSL